MIRDDAGQYVLGAENPRARDHGVKRTRYMAPVSEFSGYARRDADTRIRQSMLSREAFRVTVPDLIDVQAGQGAGIEHDVLRRYNLVVARWQYKIDHTGHFTQLTLARTEV
ncbi:MAG: hypothetical protein LBV27_01640, partial [Oscillospiraceae bacterium]|jgi:hypothetical protein|nr:hypothetical protein [Oscillospiraceae bacterium]